MKTPIIQARRFFVLCLLLILAGCGASLQSTYKTPEVNIPDEWKQATPSEIMPDLGPWWQQFGDQTLSRLIEEALACNNDLAAASIQVRRAWLRTEQAHSDLMPSPSAKGSGGISHGVGNSEAGEIRTFSLTTAVAYEWDLWGKLGSRYDAASWQAEASQEDRDAAELALIATTASTYVQLAYLNERIRLSEKSIAYARRSLELVQVKKAAGATTKVEELEAMRNLAVQEAAHTTLLQQREVSRNSLAILFNGPPKTLLSEEPQDLAGVSLPGVAAGLPANLLARRPDLRAAESRLRAAVATTDATRVSYYPSFSLTGNLGTTSSALRDLVNNPVAALGLQVALPFIEWRDMQRNIKISESDYQEAVVKFRQALYTAMADVENSLSARMYYQSQAEQLELALTSAGSVEDLLQVRYRAGKVSLKYWIDAQENRRQAEIAMIQNRYNQIINRITLAKALGGA